MGTAVSVGATFMSPACVRCCAACAPSCLVGVCLSAPVPGVINGAPTGYATVRSWCPVVFSSVRVETAGQRRGDIHVARVRAPLRPAVFSSVRVGTTGYVAVRSWYPVVFSSVRVETAGYVAVRSWCPAVFSFVHVGTAVSVGATFMSPAPGVINGAPTGYAAVRL